jgi:hypothetical protein
MLTNLSYNTDETANAVGRETPSPYNPIGPTITSVIDCRDGNDNPLDGFVIEEGAIPQALSHFFQMMLDLMPGKKEPKDENIVERTQAALARYGSRFLGPYFKNGAVERTQVYLVMSHDSKPSGIVPDSGFALLTTTGNQAVLTLEDDKPVLEFLGVARSHHVKKLNKLLQRATEVVGGTLVQSPFYELLGQQITVHPIGYASFPPLPLLRVTLPEHSLTLTQGRLHVPRQHGQHWRNQPHRPSIHWRGQRDLRRADRYRWLGHPHSLGC